MTVYTNIVARQRFVAKNEELTEAVDSTMWNYCDLLKSKLSNNCMNQTNIYTHHPNHQ